MSDCCSDSPGLKNNSPSSKHYYCPINGKKYNKVPYETVLHHIKHAWKLELKKQEYYFCDDPECDVVYFGVDNSTICKNEIRTQIGVKEQSDDALICYCFDVSKSVAESNQKAKEYVIEQTKNGLCSCTTSNPSGKCCLKDFPK